MLLSAGTSALGDGGPVAPRGFLPDEFPQEQRAETVVETTPSEAAAIRYERALASNVHRMGSPEDYATAKFVRDTLERAGWDAKIVTYDVPIALPTEQRLEFVSPEKRELNLYEADIDGDPYSSRHGEIGKPYSGYSVDGDVTGPIVYANYAQPSDFDTLHKMGVDVRGAIVLARVGHGSLTGKAFESAKHGALATLIFSDPADGGYFKGDPYPKGPWRPTSGSLRNTMTFTNAPGDPTAIGIPVPGAPHKPFSAIVLPSIPESPVTGDVAEQLIAAMGGPVAPPEWHGGFALPLHLGGAARAHFVLHSKRSFGPIWDVIATLKGSDPTQSVVVGGHRDAWTYGAVDPISGTVDLLQLGDAFGAAYKSGWRPKRSIVIGSWDGEELNLFGSETWVEQHEPELRAGMVAYMNTDEVAFGPTFGASGTPELAAMLRDAARDVRAPDGSQLDAYWRAQDPKMIVGEPCGGSDHEPFAFHESLPVAGAGFFGPFGTYHSAYDDIASLKIFDPGMHRAAAAARYTSLVVMRLASATVPDLRLSAVTDAMRARIAAWAKVDGSPRRAEVVKALDAPVALFARRAAALDGRTNTALGDGKADDATCAYRDVRAAEAAFFAPGGTDAAHWARSLLYGIADGAEVLPTLDATLDAAHGTDALTQIVNALTTAAIETRCGVAPSPAPTTPSAPAPPVPTAAPAVPSPSPLATAQPHS